MPGSIKKFEIFYLASLAVAALANVLSWDTDAIMASPVGQRFGLGIVAGTALVSLLIPLVLWYFAARRRSNIARWIITFFFAVQVSLLLWSLVRGFGLAGLLGGSGMVVFVLRAISIRFLFGAEANEWFGRKPAAATPVTPAGKPTESAD